MTLHRDPHSGEVLTRGGDTPAHSLLQRARSVPVDRPHDRYHRLPHDLDEQEQVRRARRAVTWLTTRGYHVRHDDDLAPTSRDLLDVTLGASFARLAEQIDTAPHTQDVTEALTELTAPGDGILPSTATVLAAAADFLLALGTEADHHHARQLHQLAADMAQITGRTVLLRHQLADRHTAHPYRTACAGVGPGEREASTVCSCPPPAPPASGTLPPGPKR